ncbi:hypothetical protein Gotur_005548 [Gossypium turneri]
MARSNTPINVDDGFNEYENVSKRQKPTTSKVDKDWKLQKIIIRFRALSPPCDGLSIADELILCLSQWSIHKKIFSITLDNASYNDVMVSCLKICFCVNRALLCDGAFFQVRCCAHILNLIFKADLELTDDVVAVLDYWGQQDKDYQIFSLSNEEWGNVTILSNLKLLFEEYVNNSKSISSSLARSSNVLDNDHVGSSLHQINVNRVDLGRDYDESDDYRRYLSESSTKSERSQLDIYLEEPELELNSQIDSAFSMGKKVITSFRSSFKLKTVQAVVWFDDWMRAKGFLTVKNDYNNDKNDDNDEDDEDDDASIPF